MSISAYYVLKGKHLDFARKSFASAVVLGFVMSLAALVQGDLQARNVAFTQPSKLAAMEAHFKSEPGPTRLYLFGFPDEKEQRVKYGVAIPGLLSLLIYHNTTQPVKALDQIPRSDWPPVAITFHSFHLMVSLGMLFIALSAWGVSCFGAGHCFRSAG
jgi:cytochrome d ubiquinol oxidase subunit I